VVTRFRGDDPASKGAMEFWRNDTRISSDMSLLDGYYGGLPPEFERLSRDAFLPRGTGAPGMAWQRDEAVIMGQADTNARFLRGDAATDAGFAQGDEDWADLAERARFRLRRAIASGRAAEAASWLRVHDRLRALAAAEVAPAGPPSEVEPEPDPVDTVMTVAGRVSSIALRAARATDDETIEALEAELEALEAHAAALTRESAPSESGATLDSLDSLDPVFSDPAEAAPPPDRPALLRTRERRLELGLGVADLDQALAELDRAWTGSGLSP